MASSKRSSTSLQWLSLVGVIWLQSINGTNTDFPAYSSQLKESLSISQLQLNNLSFASDAGKLFGYFSGVAALHLPLWLLLSVGSALGLLGYGLQYLSLTNSIPTLSYWHLFSLTLLAGNSICWINTVSYLLTIRNFPPRYRQVAVGMSTSYQGLSAKIYTDVVGLTFFGREKSLAKGYLFLNSVLPAAVCAVTMPSVLFEGGGEGAAAVSMDVGFVVMFVTTVATGVYSAATSLGYLTSGSAAGDVIGTAVFLAAPLMIPAAEKGRELVLQRWDYLAGREKRVHSSFAVEEGIGGGGGDEVVKLEDSRSGDDDDVGVREEIGVRKMLTRVDFWLYFLLYFSSATIGLVFLNNLGQIAESRGCSTTSSLVSLSSSFGFFGRLMPALLDYHFSRSKYVVSKPGMIAVLVAPMVGAFFLLLNPKNVSLYIGTAVIGVCTGAISSISVTTTSELFGTQNFSVNHNVLVANIPIGSFLFGYLAAILYHKQGNGSLDGKCIGSECYRTTFLLWGCVCLVGTFLGLALYVRTRKFYNLNR